MKMLVEMTLVSSLGWYLRFDVSGDGGGGGGGCDLS